ncbi:unnamed protein product [Lasius platythorax]|uniref:Uncharacterized protein n=1 Tax=Lasius platythorax TaxID=488582 RepID=A0AAV2NWP1_9HYME
MSLDHSWIPRMVHQRYLKLPTVHCIWILDAGDTVHRENIAAREKWETTHPPTSHSRGLPAMLEMVFVSRYVIGIVFTSTITFTVTCACSIITSICDMRRN